MPSKKRGARLSMHLLLDDIRDANFETTADRYRNPRVCRNCGLEEGSVAEGGGIVEFGTVVRVGGNYKHGVMRHTVCTPCLRSITKGKYTPRQVDTSADPVIVDEVPRVPEGWLTVVDAAKKLYVSQTYIRNNVDQFEHQRDSRFGLLISEASTNPPEGWYRVSDAAGLLGITKQAMYYSMHRYECRLFHGVTYIVEPLSVPTEPSLKNHVWFRRQIIDGKSYDEIAEMVGNVSAKQVQRAARRLGIDPPDQTQSSSIPKPASLDGDDAYDWLYEMFITRSLSKFQITVEMGEGVTTKDVDAALKRLNIKRGKTRVMLPKITQQEEEREVPASKLNRFRVVGRVIAREDINATTRWVTVIDVGNDRSDPIILRLKGEKSCAVTHWVQPGDYVYAVGNVAMVTRDGGSHPYLGCDVSLLMRSAQPWFPDDGSLKALYERRKPGVIILRDRERLYSVRVSREIEQSFEDVADGSRVMVVDGESYGMQWTQDGILLTVDKERYDASPLHMNVLQLVAMVRHQPKHFHRYEDFSWRSIVVWNNNGSISSATVFAHNRLAEECRDTINDGDEIYIEGHVVMSHWEKEGKQHARLNFMSASFITPDFRHDRVRAAVEDAIRDGIDADAKGLLLL